jgi:hypothetical protein
MKVENTIRGREKSSRVETGYIPTPRDADRGTSSNRKELRTCDKYMVSKNSLKSIIYLLFYFGDVLLYYLLALIFM